MHPDTTANGPQGLEQLRARQEAGVPYDMAIVDVQMPGMRGLDIIGRIRQDATRHTFPVVLLTAVHDRDTRDWVGPLECAVTLPKPVRISRLYEALCQLMDASRLGRGRRPGVASARIGGAAARAAAS
jgi:two-component system, sensor histidine kinase and response regulator